jgi:predicted helicase
MATFDEFYRSLPEDSNKRGEFFEKVFIPWFLKTDPEWSTKVKQIWLWDEYPDRWGRDCGIDLVYEDQQGKHWAVQSKCISPDREISKAEIDSFLSESNDSRIYGRLLIASTDGIVRNAQQVIDRQEKQVVCFLREHFEKSAVEFPDSPNNLSIGRRKERWNPKPHQVEAIQNVVTGLQTQTRGQLLMACGTGKTLTSLWVKEELEAKRTLVLVPSLSLLSQTRGEWYRHSKKRICDLCVCSDKSVTKRGKEDEDDWIENVSALGVPVTSDPEVIREFLQSNREGVIFSTYQSSPLIAEAQKHPGTPEFDITFADEAHRCAGKVSEAFGCVLDSQKIRTTKRLFMTATPCILSKRLKTKLEGEDIEIASMDDEDIFGKVLHRLNFSEAIEKDLLSDYRVIVIGVDDPEIKAQISNRSLISTNTGVETDFGTLASHISLTKATHEYNLQRVITFHGQIKGARRFSQEHPKVVNWLPSSCRSEKTIKAGYVSGEMSSSDRNNKINQLRNLKDEEVGILSNARCLSEGVDVPTLDGIAFIDPRSSQVDIIQAVGRAIRKSESKPYGYIILPVYLGDTENVEEEVLASRFKDVWEIILALKSQDDSLTEVLDRLRVELGKRGDINANDEGLTKIIFDLPERVQNTIGHALQTILVRNTTDNWDEIYGRVVKFVVETKSFPKGSENQQLATWLETQRGKYRKNKLSGNKIKRLEILPNWDWNPNEGKHQDWVDRVVNYLQENGHLSIPENHSELGNILSMLRTRYRGGDGIILLDQSIIDQLDTLKDKGWKWDANLETYLEKILFLKAWCIENNSVSPPRGTICKGNLRTQSARSKTPEFDLGGFAIKLRTRYRTTFSGDLPKRRKKESVKGWDHSGRSITPEEVMAVEEIPGWYWDKCEGFARVFSQCVQRGEKITNTLRVDFDLEEIRGIGNWAKGMKNKQREGRLHPFEEKVLLDLNGWDEYLDYSSRGN